MDSTKPHRLDLDTEIQYVKGVGHTRAKAFRKAGVNKLYDLLEYYPRKWSFMPEPVKIKEIVAGQTVCIIGIIEQTDYKKFRKPRIFSASVADDSGMCKIIWFNGGYLQNQLEPGKIIMASGKSSIYKYRVQLTNPKFSIIENEDDIDPDTLSGATYPASANLTNRHIKKIIKPIIEELSARAPEFYTKEFQKKNELIPRPTALHWIHTPPDEEELKAAVRRLKFDELFVMQLAMALKRHHLRHTAPARAMVNSDMIDSRIRKRFPFLLTADQDTVISEIAQDMRSTIPMNRLLQGDVGSGKTVVALYAALLAIANKSQAAIMAPTEILATQHFNSIEKFLHGSKVKAALITGSMPAKKRTEVLEQIKSGEINIVAGTVALLNENIDFNDLGVVIIDEQHKFGVHQRSKLRKAQAPHCLVMTATPIPRTLAMTAFGDLDVSTIRNCPPGRGKVVTRWVKPHDRVAALEFIRQRLRAKKQAYFVYPRIDNIDETSDVKAATQEFKILSKKIFPEFKVALLHGQMKSDDKQLTMEKFRKGQIDALIATIVIEVGVDVPNATMMIIEGANRFGLAQLHQLRGRIGRGQSNSYCFLFAETEDENAISRLEIMTRSNNGFEIAEHDLKLRGPGEIFSTRQHGLPDLKIANIIEDFDLLNLARKDAFQTIKKDPLLESPQNKNLRNELINKFGEKLGLIDIA
ncbi:MAG: ATP-dependent DNA helicase RecG [Planctomycetes bacterium]|nr:ATP-dependent DNA helicase RecG [Planctomycetota bacterium]